MIGNGAEIRPLEIGRKGPVLFSSSGLVVTKVSTIDNDALTDPKSDNAKVTYRITQGAGDAFSIREDNGEIIVTGKVKLDFDQHSTYEIEVSRQSIWEKREIYV